MTGASAGGTAAEITARLRQLAARAELDPALLPDFTPNGEARPYLRIDEDGTLRWRVDETGRRLQDRSTRDPDELAYWVFGFVTSGAAADWELSHRVVGEDSRRGRWARQWALLVRLDPSWAARWRRELSAELRATGESTGLELLPGAPPAD